MQGITVSKFMKDGEEMNDQTIILKCSNGFTLRAEGSNLIVTTKRTEESIRISQIQSFTLKNPGAISPGKIVFSTAQAPSAGVNLGLGVGVAIGAEKSFFFSSSDLDTALKLRDYVTGFTEHQVSTDSTASVVSVVEEIRGLKVLLDEGILTQEEFDAKKKLLLGI